MILTLPSLLVEGVRSGSRKRNAATPSSLTGGLPGRNRGIQHLCERMLRCTDTTRMLYTRSEGSISGMVDAIRRRLSAISIDIPADLLVMLLGWRSIDAD